jgi:hypothetical protein
MPTDMPTEKDISALNPSYTMQNIQPIHNIAPQNCQGGPSNQPMPTLILISTPKCYTKEAEFRQKDCAFAFPTPHRHIHDNFS